LLRGCFATGTDLPASKFRTVLFAHLCFRCWFGLRKFDERAGCAALRGCHLKGSVLSIITGGGKWIEFSIEADPICQTIMIDAEEAFRRSVKTGDARPRAGLALPQPRDRRRNTHKPWPGGGEGFDATIEVPVTIRNPDKPIGTHVFTAMARNDTCAGPLSRLAAMRIMWPDSGSERFVRH
jgi:hypothetical protein